MSSPLPTSMRPIRSRPSRPAGHVAIVEVGPREGTQARRNAPFPIGQTQHLVRLLAKAGFRDIESAAFVDPKVLPQMANAAEIARALVPLAKAGGRNPAQSQDPEGAIRHWALAGNSHYFGQAREDGLTNIALFTAANADFNAANRNGRTFEQDLSSFERFVPAAIADGVFVRGYVSTVFGYKTAGDTKIASVLNIVQRMLGMGIQEISLGDTTGLASPDAVSWILSYLASQRIPMDRIAMHFHQSPTFNLGRCVMAAYDAGITVFDGSIGGIGGCPNAEQGNGKKAEGNVATEDLAILFAMHQIDTGLDLRALNMAAQYARNYMGFSLHRHYSA